MINKTICEAFGVYDIQSCRLLSNGLINNSYKVDSGKGHSYFFQQVNTDVFTKPASLQNNYLLIEEHLSSRKTFFLPKLIKTLSGELLHESDNEVWRCFEFVPDTLSPQTVDTPKQAYEVANCFGRFTAALHHFDSRRLDIVIPHFHDLSFRYAEFQTALQNSSPGRIYKVKDLIGQVIEHQHLVSFFQQIKNDNRSFPLHVMHHDCKVSNILFEKETGAVHCPIDLDTTQPGWFFSDIGDMIRTMAPGKSENEREIETIEVRPDFLKAILAGYTDAMRDCLTKEETENLYKSGLMMTYMQAMRFLTDYLNGNVYYKTAYEEQNKDRAANQLRLLYLLNTYAEPAII